MAKWNFLFVVIFAAIFCELVIGSWGVILPLCALLVFYLTIAYNWHIGLTTALICGLTIDFLLGRSMVITPFSLSVIMVIAVFWHNQVESESLLLHVIPGVFVAVVYLVPLVLLHFFKAGFNLWIIWNNTANMVFAILACAVMLPMEIVILDYISHGLEIDMYSKMQTRTQGRRR